MGILIPVIVTVAILAFLIIIHELGHFFAARSVGVEVEEFGIGIPPRVRGWKWKGVLWSLNAIPFGGFVRVKGEDGADMSKGSMNAAGPLQRAWFLIAGPAMNLLAALVISVLIIAFQGKPIQTAPLYIGTVAPSSPAEQAGWRPGDKIVAVDGVTLHDTQQIVNAINSHAGESTEITIERGTQVIDTVLTPREHPPSGEGATGIGVDDGRLSTVTIDNVDGDSVAYQAGLRDGDRIVAIDGVRIEAFAQAVGLLNGAQGSEATISVVRDGTPQDITFAVPPASILVRGVQSGSPASDAKLYEGDEITAVNGEPVGSSPAFVKAIRDNAGKDVDIAYTREGKERSTTIAIPPAPEDTTGYDPVRSIGLSAAPVPAFMASGVSIIGEIIYEHVPASRVIPEGWDQTWFLITGTVDMIRDMATNGVDTSQLTGPIGMGQLTSEVISKSPDPVWAVTSLAMLISISLGVLNLLPLPALDGGRLMFVILEIVRGGKRIAPEKEGLVHLAGMVLLLGLMFFIAFGDITRIIDGKSILP